MRHGPRRRRRWRGGGVSRERRDRPALASRLAGQALPPAADALGAGLLGLLLGERGAAGRGSGKPANSFLPAVLPPRRTSGEVASGALIQGTPRRVCPEQRMKPPRLGSGCLWHRGAASAGAERGLGRCRDRRTPGSSPEALIYTCSSGGDVSRSPYLRSKPVFYSQMTSCRRDAASSFRTSPLQRLVEKGVLS